MSVIKNLDNYNGVILGILQNMGWAGLGAGLV
jgi:hypothetical protein